MRIKTIIKNGEVQGYRVELKITGKGGELGARAVNILVDMIVDILKRKTKQEVDMASATAARYAHACVDFKVIDEECIDELTQVILIMRNDAWARLEGKHGTE